MSCCVKKASGPIDPTVARIRYTGSGFGDAGWSTWGGEDISGNSVPVQMTNNNDGTWDLWSNDPNIVFMYPTTIYEGASFGGTWTKVEVIKGDTLLRFDDVMNSGEGITFISSDGGVTEIIWHGPMNATELENMFGGKGVYTQRMKNLVCVNFIDTTHNTTYGSPEMFTELNSLVSPNVAAQTALMDYTGSVYSGNCNSPLACDVQPGSNFTFKVIVGQNVAGDQFGFSDGTGPHSSETFGSIVLLDVPNPPVSPGMDDVSFLGIESGDSWFNSTKASGGQKYDYVNTIFQDGIDITPMFSSGLIFSSSDIGKTYCISLNAVAGG